MASGQERVLRSWRESAAALGLDADRMELVVLRLLEQRSGYPITAEHVLTTVLCEAELQMKGGRDVERRG